MKKITVTNCGQKYTTTAYGTWLPQQSACVHCVGLLRVPAFQWQPQLVGPVLQSCTLQPSWLVTSLQRPRAWTNRSTSFSKKKKKKKERAPSTSKDFNIILFSFEDPLQGAGFQRKGKASRDDKPKGSVLYNKLGKYICMLDKIVINIEYV